MNNILDLESQLQDLHDEALSIKSRAERAGRDLTSREATQLDQIFASFDRTERELQLAKPGTRATAPDYPGAGPMSAYTPQGGRRGGISSQYLDPREHLLDTRGNIIPVLAQTDRFVDLHPRGDRCEPTDLAAFIYGCASGDWSRLSNTATRIMGAMGGQSDSTGGYLLPSPLSSEILDILRSASVFMRAPGVRTVPMSTRTLDFAGVVDTVTPEWRAEHDPITESQVTLGPVRLEAKNLGGMVRVSEELVDDAPNASQLIRDQLAKELAAELDRALFFGAGGVVPTGLVNQANVPTTSGVGTPSSYTFLMTALGALWGRNVTPTTLVLSADTKVALASLSTGISGDLTQLVAPRELTELTWLVTNKMGNFGSPNASYAILGDFSGALVGMRQPLRLEVSNAGGFYESDSPTVGGDAFSRVQLRVRATLRADLALAEPLKFQVLEDIAE